MIPILGRSLLHSVFLLLRVYGTKFKFYAMDWTNIKVVFRLLLRIRVGSEKEINLEEKFGCDFESEAVDLLEEAASLGLKVSTGK